MVKILTKAVLPLLFLAFGFPAVAVSSKRVLYVDSYHEGYAWSDGITKAIEDTLAGKDVVLKIHRMDTKRNGDDQFKRNAAYRAKMAIEQFQPDIVIASDDDASKYLIEPYFKNDKLPFIFCGVNYSAEAYGFPYPNVTGILEVPSVLKLIYSLKFFTRVETIGYLASDTLTERKDGEFTRRDIREAYKDRYVATFEEWKNAFVSMQNEVDVLIVGNNAGIKDWDNEEAARFAIANTRKPTGCLLEWMSPYAFIGAIRTAREQGSYAAETALKVLNGTDIGSIPIARNTQADIIVNMQIAKKLNIKVPSSFLKLASKIIE